MYPSEIDLIDVGLIAQGRDWPALIGRAAGVALALLIVAALAWALLP